MLNLRATGDSSRERNFQEAKVKYVLNYSLLKLHEELPC